MKFTRFISMPYLLNLLLLSALLSFACVSSANTNNSEIDEWLPQATSTIKNQEKRLKNVSSDNISVKNLSPLLEEITPVKSQAQTCIADTDIQLLKVTDDLITLGKSTDKEITDVTKKRLSLSIQKKNLDTRQSSCKLLLLQSQDLIQTINELQQTMLAEQLSARTPHIIFVLIDNLKTPVAGWQDSVDFLIAQYKLKLLNVQQFTLLIILAIIAFGVGFHYANRLRETAAQSEQPTDSVSAYILAVRSCFAPALPMLLTVATTAAY